MDSTHITPELLDSIIQHELPPAVLSRLVWDHVRDLCPTCGENLDRWVESNRKSGFASGGLAFPSAGQGTGEAGAEELAEARAEREELLRIPEAKRLEALQQGERRFRHPLLVDLLIQQAEQRIHDDPRQAVHLTRVARAAADRMPGLGSLERRVRALAHLGNALRASGDVLAADRIFQEVRDLLGDGAGVAVPVFAEVDLLEGSLRLDQRHYDEAEKVLSRAILVFKVFGQHVAAAKALLNLAFAQPRMARVARSLSHLREAVDLLDPEKNLDLVTFARHNLAALLCDSGDAEEAARVLDESRGLFARYFDSVDARGPRLKLRWLEGRIARGLDDLATAETALREAAEGFVELEIGYDAALAYLDLAEVYLARGEVEEVARLAAAVEPILKANDLAEEAVAALALFRGAATRQHLTGAILEQVRDRVQQTR